MQLWVELFRNATLNITVRNSTLSMTTVSVTIKLWHSASVQHATVIIMTLSITINNDIRYHNTKCNTLHNNPQHHNKIAILSIMTLCVKIKKYLQHYDTQYHHKKRHNNAQYFNKKYAHSIMTLRITKNGIATLNVTTKILLSANDTQYHNKNAAHSITTHSIIISKQLKA
jgi:hypothetical protein